MPSRCVAMFCSHAHNQLYEWPSSHERSRLWTKFVQVKRDKWNPSSRSVLCSEHFSDDCFVNLKQFNMGFAKRLRLNELAVPTKQATPEISNPLSQPKPLQRNAAVKLGKRRIIEELNINISKSNTKRESEISEIVKSEEFTTASPPPAVAIKKTANTADKKTQTLKDLHKEKCEGCRKKKLKSIGMQTEEIKVEEELRNEIEEDEESMEDYDEEVDDRNDEDYFEECEDDENDVEEDEEDEFGDWSSVRFDEVEMTYSENINLQKEPKYIVFESSLLTLLEKCNTAGCTGRNRCFRSTWGTQLRVKMNCRKCNTTKEWTNQPIVSNIPVLNILLSAAILFTGSLPSKTLRVLSFLNIQCHKIRTYFNHQKKYLNGVIECTWKKHTAAILNSVKGKGLVLGGDARCDSMGHCAKFGSYCFMELDLNKILSVNLVQSNETNGSYHMEMEGLKRCKDDVAGLEIQAFVSDRHRQVAKWVRDEWKIPHFFDCWHIVKGLQKKLVALSKRRGYELLTEWIPSLKCHLYWVAMSSADKETIKEKWLSCVDHIQNKHEKCLHGPLTQPRKWFKTGTEVCENLVELLTKTCFVNDVSKMSSLGQTSGVECYHSIVNHFAPKMYKFSYGGMKSRIVLAALHYNENSGRSQAFNKDGKAEYSIVFPKYKLGGYTLKKVLVDATYDYADECFQELLATLGTKGKQTTASEPPPLNARYVRPDKDQVVDSFRTRFK